MKLKTTLNGQTFAFRDIRDVLAKANEPKAADRLQGVAAETVTERVAAKIVLSELTVGELTENPTVPYEKDEVTRVNLDGLNQPTYQRFKGMTIGELREWILDHKTTGDDLVRSCRAFTGEVAAAVAKLMSAMDLVYGASKIHHITRCNTTIGQPGVLAFRNQPNSPTDDPEEILIQMMEGVSYGCGDACMGINPVENNVESTRRIADAVYSFICRNDIPTQLVVLSHMTTQMDAIRKGAPLSMIFQSIAGTEAANSDFGVSRQLCTEAYELACQHALSTGPNLLYFETGQGSEVSIGADCGVDEMTLEARTYGFGRFFRPFMVNNVSGFIGPETLYDGKEMIRASLGSLHGQADGPAHGHGPLLHQPHLHYPGRAGDGHHAAQRRGGQLLHRGAGQRRYHALLPGHQLPRQRHPAGALRPSARAGVPPVDDEAGPD